MADHFDIDLDFSKDVTDCVLTLDRTLGQLARRHGAAAVAAALIEVIGCSSCVADGVSRGASMRTLLGRIDVGK